MGLFTGTNGSDNYGRSFTAAAARTLLNVANGATNVTNNNQLTNGAGYKTTDTNTTYTAGTGMSLSGTTFNCTVVNTDTNTQLSDADIAKFGYIKTDTNTTYTADGNYGMTLSGTTFRLEDDRRRNSSSTDIYTGNTHDYTFYDASVGIRWYTAGGEDMRLLDNGEEAVLCDENYEMGHREVRTRYDLSGSLSTANQRSDAPSTRSRSRSPCCCLERSASRSG